MSKISYEMQNAAEAVHKCSDCNLIFEKGVKRVAIWEKGVLVKVICKSCFSDFKFKKFYEKNIGGMEAQRNAK